MKWRKIIAVATAVAWSVAWSAQFGLLTMAQQAGVPQSAPAIRATTELVLVNVVARDKKGNLVRDLKREDFTVLEDGQKQQVSSFDFENIDEMTLAGQTTPTATGTEGAVAPTAGASAPAQPVLDARDRRLIMLFFDFSAMEPDQIDHAVDAAKKYVNSRMQPADLLAIV